MSESHFRRVFRELVGMGPLDYLNRTRIAKACSLLRMTDDSILTISEKVGFGSMSSFNRHFYEVMGTAPSDWRRATGTGIGTSILKYSGWLRPPTP
ncbi:MAG: helix-turn-helix transcriptional regulator [Subdoligranulum sp.]